MTESQIRQFAEMKALEIESSIATFKIQLLIQVHGSLTPVTQVEWAIALEEQIITLFDIAAKLRAV